MWQSVNVHWKLRVFADERDVRPCKLDLETVNLYFIGLVDGYWSDISFFVPGSSYTWERRIHILKRVVLKLH